MTAHRRVGEVMRPVAVAVGPSDTAADALRRMRRGNVRVAPVLTGDGRVVGVLSASDLSSALSGAARTAPTVRQIVRSTATTRVDATASAARRMMRRGRLPCLPVTDRSGYLLGVVSPADVAQAVATPGS
jgi:CBS domain-containing protein